MSRWTWLWVIILVTLTAACLSLVFATPPPPPQDTLLTRLGEPISPLGTPTPRLAASPLPTPISFPNRTPTPAPLDALPTMPPNLLRVPSGYQWLVWGPRVAWAPPWVLRYDEKRVEAIVPRDGLVRWRYIPPDTYQLTTDVLNAHAGDVPGALAAMRALIAQRWPDWPGLPEAWTHLSDLDDDGAEELLFNLPLLGHVVLKVL